MVTQFGGTVSTSNNETADLTTDNKVAEVVTDDTKTKDAGVDTSTLIEGAITNDIEKQKADKFFADEAKSDNTTNTAKANENVSS